MLRKSASDVRCARRVTSRPIDDVTSESSGGVPEVRYWTCVAQSVAAARGHRCSNHSLLVMDQETRFNETEPMTYNHRLKLPKVLISR